ncbi:MAG: hypothetical protein ABI850_19325, partial [Flavobacterium sp.]
MRNIIWSFLMFFCLMTTSFSQTKSIEKGTYISTNKGQKIKLNLLDDNNYELVFYSGEYKIQGDSLMFSQNKKVEDAFSLSFKNDKKAKKIKIKFLDPSYNPFYIGTQKGSEPVQYQRLSDIKTKTDPDWAKIDLDFEIDRTDYLYLVFEGSEAQGKTKLYKYALPKDVSEVTIKYEFNVLHRMALEQQLASMPADTTTPAPLVIDGNKSAIDKILEADSIKNGKKKAVDPDSSPANDVPPPTDPSTATTGDFDGHLLSLINGLKDDFTALKGAAVPGTDQYEAKVLL